LLVLMHWINGVFLLLLLPMMMTMMATLKMIAWRWRGGWRHYASWCQLQYQHRDE